MIRVHAHRPRTVRQRMDMPRNHYLYTTTIRAASETELPEIGDSMEGLLGPSFTDQYVLECSDAPDGGGDDHVHTISHSVVPADHTEYESVAYTFPPIYPDMGDPQTRTFFVNGSEPRGRVVIGRVTYEYSRLATEIATWRADPTYSHVDATDAACGPFEVDSVLALAAGQSYEDDDGNYRSIGSWLVGQYVMNNTLNDGMYISDPGTLYYLIGESNPSATTYAGWVEDHKEIMASRVITRWRGDMYMRVTRYVIAQ
jgi:hypothetical protein